MGSMNNGVVDTVARSDATAAQVDATQALADAGAAQADATQALADAALRAEEEFIPFTRDLSTASGVVNYAVPSGRTPKSIDVIATTLGSTSLSFGKSNGTARECCITQGTGASNFLNDRVALLYAAGSNSASQSAVDTISAGNVALTWTKTNLPTGTVSGAIVCRF